jgi:hypothetical protein
MAEPSQIADRPISSGPDGGDGWSIFTWFGGGNSAEDSSGNPGGPVRSDSGGGDRVVAMIDARVPWTTSSVLIYRDRDS